MCDYQRVCIYSGIDYCKFGSAPLEWNQWTNSLALITFIFVFGLLCSVASYGIHRLKLKSTSEPFRGPQTQRLPFVKLEDFEPNKPKSKKT